MRNSLPKSRILLSNVWASLFCAAEPRLDQNTQTKIFAHTYFDWNEDWGTLEQDHDFCSQMFFVLLSREIDQNTQTKKFFAHKCFLCCSAESWARTAGDTETAGPHHSLPILCTWDMPLLLPYRSFATHLLLPPPTHSLTWYSHTHVPSANQLKLICKLGFGDLQTKQSRLAEQRHIRVIC